MGTPAITIHAQGPEVDIPIEQLSWLRDCLSYINREITSGGQ
jgi:hypothetical protein